MKKIISILAISLSVLTVNAQTPKDSLVEKKLVSFMVTPIVTDVTESELNGGNDANSPKYVIYPMDRYNQGAVPVKMKNIIDLNRKKKELECKNFKYHYQIYKFNTTDNMKIISLERKHYNGKERNPRKSPFIYYTWRIEGSEVILNVLSGSRDF
jgi:hypothetical protein